MLDRAHGNIFSNAGKMGQMQIRPNFQKLSQKVKQNICDQSKQQKFHNRNAKLPCAENFCLFKLSRRGVFYFAVCCV